MWQRSATARYDLSVSNVIVCTNRPNPRNVPPDVTAIHVLLIANNKN